MSLLCAYSDSEGEEEEEEEKKINIKGDNENFKQEKEEADEDDKLSILKVTEKPYGLLVTEETTSIDETGKGEDYNYKDEDQNDNSNNNNNHSNSNNSNNENNDEMSYQIADTESDKLNHCHTIIHTIIENKEYQPKELQEPDTPSRLQSPAYVSTPPHSKDPYFHNLSPKISIITADTILKSKIKQNIDTSFIPEAPKDSQVDFGLKEKIIRYHKMKQDGISINQALRNSSSFKNPSVIEKLISFCEIDELGSNYPLSQFNPHSYPLDDYYKPLNEKQRKMDEKREFERINRMKIDFVQSEINNNNNSINNNNINSNNNNNNIANPTPSIPTNTAPKKKYNKWEKEKHKQKQLQQQKSKATFISAAPSIAENPTPTNTTTTSVINKSESLMKRFRTNGF
ncbi:hypothetical protein DDB_G0279635 [Dictyostelium discoideum AX4]|uniref:Uncharacterized protein n=1 Tax=Dictyostelium discoideum TaxID=44689 RepID=Q54WI7_DICDI|nr:hypothetical protein DDB_G0279635 [Dictyostelium discoideum AX4]EAL67592.1 hypothetical protein DDB_G0279635 [Dictyostelium discoideum AX4]|eukprot:XP_641566.1 hypothetical protein DDB_G0279635 [Dictyostelium discoideum AX4]